MSRTISGKPKSVYPRECGGTSVMLLMAEAGEGLSPRVRGNRIES